MINVAEIGQTVEERCQLRRLREIRWSQPVCNLCVPRGGSRRMHAGYEPVQPDKTARPEPGLSGGEAAGHRGVGAVGDGAAEAGGEMTTTVVSTSRPSSESAVVVRAVTVIVGVVVGLTFLFGFGNVLNLALRLGVPGWVAPLVAPAVDLSVIGLLLGTRHLALAGALAAVLRPARRLLIFASVVTPALNVADPLVAGDFGKAAFDAVGPLLLIGWAEVGPGLLQAIGESGASVLTGGVATVEQSKTPEPVEAGCVAVGQGKVVQVESDPPRLRRSLGG